MRILFATDAFPPRAGGSGWSTFYLARALAARGHAVEVVMPRQGVTGLHTRVYDGLRVLEFGFHAANLPGLRAWQRAAVLGGPFAELLAERAGEADLIHAQHLLTIPPAVQAGRLAGRPVVSTVRDYWPLCLYGTLWRDGGVCPVCRGSELTRCLEQKYGRAAALARPLTPLVARELTRRQRALAASDAVVAVSRYVAARLESIVPASKLTVIPNLVDVEETRRLAQAEGEQASEPFLIFVGKLNALKGADLLPAILRESQAQLPLVVAGSGELASALAAEQGIELRGWLPNEEVLRLVARARALLFPSRWAEPLARTLLEAQALGVPTVALDTGGTRDIITHDLNGLLAQDAQGMARELARLLADPELAARLRLEARRTAGERFGSPVGAARMEGLYAALVARPPDAAAGTPEPIALPTLPGLSE